MGGVLSVYLIALCDDETEELNKTEQMLYDYKKKHPGMDFRAERFKSAYELLCKVREGNYIPDLLLMDIYICRRSRGLKQPENCVTWEMEAELCFLPLPENMPLRHSA